MKEMGTIQPEGDCLFCDVAAGRKKEKIAYQDERFIAFKDADPSAPVHLLVCPLAHVGLSSEAAAKEDVLGEVFAIARKIAKQEGVGDSYKLLVNAGHSATVSPDHLHIHLVGGWETPTGGKHV